MSKADVHVEVKLMQTGQRMELPVVFNQPFPFAYIGKASGLWLDQYLWLQSTQSTSEHAAVQTSSPSSSALTQVGRLSNQVRFIQQPGDWCLGSRGLSCALLSWSVPRMVQRLGNRGGLRPPVSLRPPRQSPL